MPGPHPLGVPAEDAGLSQPVAPVLARESRQGVAAEIGGSDLGRKDDAATGSEQSIVELVVFAAVHVLGVVAGAFEGVAKVGAEGHAVGLLQPGAGMPEGRVADAKAG